MADEPEVTDGGESPLDALVGEGKKYANVQELAKAYMHSQDFIETLIAEKRELEGVTEETLARQNKIDDVLKLLRGEPPADPQETIQSDPDKGDTPMAEDPSNEAPVVDEEQILTKVEARMQQKALRDQSYALLLDACGGDVDLRKEVVTKYINGNDARKALVDNLAVTDPEGLVRLLQPKPKANPDDGALPEGRKVGEEGDTGKLTWEQAKKIKKENPKLYYSPAFQNRMHQAAASNPDFMKKEK